MAAEAGEQPDLRLNRYRRRYDTGNSTERVVFFSDAVFAIAMTLLVLEIKVPEAPVGDEFYAELRGQLPHVFAYLLSFALIARTWIGHHNKWKFVERYDRGLIWLNMAQLVLIAFLPVPTALIAAYGPEVPLAPMLYAATIAGTGYFAAAAWAYAGRRGYLSAEVEPEMYRWVRRKLLVTPIVFTVTVVLAIFAPLAAMLSWIAVVPGGAIADAQTRRRLARVQAA